VSVTIDRTVTPSVSYIVVTVVATLLIPFRVIAISIIFVVFAEDVHHVTDVGKGSPAGSVSSKAPLEKPS
jgi:hypothetical protein